MSIVTVYRAFRTRCHTVYERPIDDLAVLAMENAGTPYIQWMLEVPTIFTKAATPALVRELADLPFFESLDAFMILLEAYPFSYHHGAAPELGIIISINHAFKIKKAENQRNWEYTHVWIVDKGLRRTKWPIKELPTHAKNPTKTFHTDPETKP